MKKEHMPLAAFGALIILSFVSIFLEMRFAGKNIGYADRISVITLLVGIWAGILGIQQISRKQTNAVSVLSIFVGVLSVFLLFTVAQIG
jgi:hypothetical protein